MKAKLWLRSSAPMSVLLAGLSLLLWTDAAWAAFASGSSFCTANVSTGATSWTFATSAQLTAGNVGVIVLATDNLATTDGNTNDHSSITDAAGNTWTKAREYTNAISAAADAATVSVWYSKASFNLSGNITVNLSGSIAAKAVTCWQFTMGAGNMIVVEGGADRSDDQADAGLITLSGLPNIEHLFIRGTASEASGQTYTASTNYTAFNSTSSTFVGGATSTSMDARGEFRIFTATTDTTDPAMSSTARDRASTMVALREVGLAPAPTFQAAGTAQPGTGALTVAWPTHQTDDIGLLIVETAKQAVTLGTNAANWTEVTNSPQGTGTAGNALSPQLTVFWSRATSSSMGSVGVNDSGDHQIAQIITFRGVANSGNPWDVTAGDVNASTTSAVSIPGATTTVPNTLVVAIVANAADTNTAQTSGWTNSSLSSLTDQTAADVNTNSGVGGGFGVATGVKATAGAYGATTATLATVSPQGRMSIALRPPGTTLGDGTNPGPATLAPGGAATMLDAFTLQTGGGTDAVTAATVTLVCSTCGGVGAYTGISKVEITDSTGVTVYGTVNSPSSDAVSFANMSIPVTTSLVTFMVRITPQTHAGMPVPPGVTYTVTGTVTAVTSGYSNSGTDTASGTVTIDNQSPANVTSASAAGGAGQVTVSWANPGGDFSNVVILRNTATISDVPTEGTAPAVDSSVGSSVVRYILGTSPFVDTGLSGGTQYFYRIFAKDSSGNYSATGVEVSAATNPAVTLGEVASGGVESGGSTFSISHTTSGMNRVLLVGVSWNGNQTVSSVKYAGTDMTSIGSVFNGSNSRAQLFYLVAPATGPNTVLVTLSGAPVEIVVGAVTFTGANQTTPVGTFASATGSVSPITVNVTSNAGETVLDTLFITSSSTVTAGGGQTQRWQVNPKDWRGAGSTEPGASSVTMSWTSGNSAWAIGAVGVKPAATCSSVPDATYVSANTQGTQATVYWSSSNPVLILRKTAAFVSEAPSSGASYNVNEAIGAATVAFTGTGTSFTETGLATGTTYYYKVFPKTSLPCYAPGIAVSVSPVVSAVWGYSTTAATMIPPALDPWSNVVVTGSNDNNFHGMVESDGTLKFAPVGTGNPIQARPATVPAAYRRPTGSGVNIAYVTSQDGSVYAMDTSNGGPPVWTSPFLPPSVGTGKLQGGVSVWLQAVKSLSICGVSTSDVVFVGTRDGSNKAGNKVYALNGSGGPVTIPGGQGINCAPAGSVAAGGILWTYTGSGTSPCSTCLDIIVSTPYVDYTNNVVWVTSNANGQPSVQPSVWKINASNGTLAGGTATWIFNDVDSSPVPNADGAYIYVGTNAGTLKAIKVSDGTVATHTPSSGTGAIKGMPWPLSYSAASGGSPDQIIFSRTATVHSVKFDGQNFLTCPANCWTTTPTGGPATVSTPVDDGAGNLYIGGSEGKVHRLLVSNGSDAAQVPATAISGQLGDPTFNYDLNKIHVGATDGHVYTFATGF